MSGLIVIESQIKILLILKQSICYNIKMVIVLPTIHFKSIKIFNYKIILTMLTCTVMLCACRMKLGTHSKFEKNREKNYRIKEITEN